MMKLNKLSLKKFLSLSSQEKENIVFILENGLRENKVLRVGKKEFYPVDIWRISYSEMIFMKDNIESDNFIDCINIVYNTTEYIIERANIFNVFCVFEYIKSRMKDIKRLEEQEFNNDEDKDDQRAGIDIFNKYGYYNELRSLTGGDRTKDKFYLDMPYIDVFMELTYKSNLIKFEKKLSEIKNK